MDYQFYVNSICNASKIDVEVPEKSHKYKRFSYEKRAKRTSDKKMQTEEVTVTKWDTEIAKNKNKKIGRNRDRMIKYGEWDDQRTDTAMEDNVNIKEREQLALRVDKYREKRTAERRKQAIRRSLAEFAELIFPKFSLTDRSGWTFDAWQSYHEYLEYSSTARAREREYQTMFHEQRHK